MQNVLTKYANRAVLKLKKIMFYSFRKREYFVETVFIIIHNYAKFNLTNIDEHIDFSNFQNVVSMSRLSSQNKIPFI